MTRKMHYYFNSICTCFDLNFLDFCNVYVGILCLFQVFGLCVSKWWKTVKKKGKKIQLPDCHDGHPPSMTGVMLLVVNNSLTGWPSHKLVPVMVSKCRLHTHVQRQLPPSPTFSPPPWTRFQNFQYELWPINKLWRLNF